MSSIISVQDAKSLLEKNSAAIKFVDASYGPPSFVNERIGNAVHFDIDDVAHPDFPLTSHMAPPADLFESKVMDLGLSNGDTIIVYDQRGIYMAAARVWLMFKSYGHENVHVLDGGLPAWKTYGFPVNNDAPVPPARGTYSAAENKIFKSISYVENALEHKTSLIIDARDAGRFSGQVGDPRSGLQNGHIPGSANIPFMSLLNEDGTIKSRETLENILAPLEGYDEIISSCGSGVTACVLALALDHAGHEGDVVIYDGSWSEWGRVDANRPVETGTGMTLKL